MNNYAASQIFLHWLTLLLLVLAYGTVQIRPWVPDGPSWQGYAVAITHITAGATVFCLMLLRLFLRLIKRTPAIVPVPKRWHTGMAHLTHTCLYALFIALPASAILSRYFWGAEWSLYGVAMPYADAADHTLSKRFNQWHKLLAPLGYWLIGLHTAAALAHHYLFKDNTLLRMMPSRRQRR
ncbi:cytochrome b561 [Erwinia sp. 9145]|uniref:cytochrome b561 n=1 Tax=Erwinia sp. 9145 TaxID=1500895 RepID=UPI0005572CA3|nr:cytochrome b561 [Erwinia sp. 9145]